MHDQPSTNNETLLRELALRLTSFPGDYRVRDAEPQLFVGQLPPNLSIEIPLPEGCRILGTLARSPENLDIVLDCPQTPQDTLAFYKERLTAAGWNELEEMGIRHGGFLHSGIPMLENRATFCKEGAAFNVSASAGKHGQTDARLDLQAAIEHSPCSQRQLRHRDMNRQHRRHLMVQQMVPTLVPPKGARQQGGGGGGSDDNWHSSATLFTDMGLPELATHYRAQLEKGGWTLTGQGVDGPLAWSSWTLQDEEKEPWRGLFYILKAPGKATLHELEVRISLDNEDTNDSGGMRFTSGGGGWSSYTTLG